MKSEVKISGNRIQITQVFDAPRPLVFAWWTQAEKLQQWSGCKAATKCEIEMDFRGGGFVHSENAHRRSRRILHLEASYLPPCRGLRMSSTDIPRCTGPRKR